MKANELRIGNYVSVYGTYGNANKWKVLKINAHEIYLCDTDPKRFKPVKITKHFIEKKLKLKLLKNPWTKDSYKCEILINKKSIDKRFTIEDIIISLLFFSKPKENQYGIYRQYYLSFCILLTKNDVGDRCDLKDNIKYVHQLQNLYYSLTGEEL